MSALLVDHGPFESQDTSARRCMGRMIGEIPDDRRHNTPFVIVRETLLMERWEADRQYCPLRTELGRG